LIPLLTKEKLKIMLKSTVSVLIISASLFVALPGAARASDIIVQPTFDPSSNQAAPPDTTDYEGLYFDGTIGAPPYDLTIGTFDFSIPTGDYVTGGTISGTFGDENSPTTALADLFVLDGSIEVGECDSYGDPCAAGTLDGSLVPWSYTFNSTDLSNLASDFSSGSLDFTAIQNSLGATIVGAPSLDLTVAPTPEPASIFTLAGGLLAIAALRRRK
jgi:hypothetical protein